MQNTFLHILLLTRYVPDVTKRSIWILPTDDRPTSHFGKFQMAITLQRVTRYPSCLVTYVSFWGTADHTALLQRGLCPIWRPSAILKNRIAWQRNILIINLYNTFDADCDQQIASSTPGYALSGSWMEQESWAIAKMTAQGTHYVWVPWKFRESISTPTATFPESFNGLLLQLSL